MAPRNPRSGSAARTRSASRGSARSRGSSRSSSSDSSQMKLVIGAAAVAVVVILLILVSGNPSDAKAASPERAPAAVPASSRAAPAPIATDAGKAGKTPDRPAPELSGSTLQRLDEILAEAKVHYNEGVKKRLAGDNSGARACQAEAKKLLDQWENLIQPQLLWQEEAELSGWQQPGSYQQLEHAYVGFASLQKMVRMGGGQ